MSTGEARWDAGDEEAAPGLPAFVTDPWGVARRRWPWMLGALVLGLAATLVVYALWKPRYVAQATVLITSQQIPEDFVRSTVREDSISYINAMVGTVLSQDNLLRLLEQLDLYPELRDKVSRMDQVGLMRSNIEVEPVAGGGRGEASLIYGLSFEADDREQAAAVANSLAGLFIEASIVRRNEQARRTTEFLKRELERDERELRTQSGLVSEFRREHRGQLPGELATNLHKLELLGQRRASLTADIADKRNRLATLDPSATASRSENALLLDELRRQLAGELAINTEEHPNVVALRRRVANLERVVGQERLDSPDGGPERLRRAEERDIAAMQAQIAQIDQEVIDVNARIDATPSVGEQLAAFEQKEAVLRENYLDSLRKVEAAELSESLEAAQQGAQVAILDRAQPPSGPIRPRWVVLLAGAGATLALSLALAVLLELVDPVVVSARQLEGIAEHPVLGSLPRIA